MIPFLTLTWGRRGPDFADWLAWAWLLLRALAILVPVLWAALSSLRSPEDIEV